MTDFQSEFLSAMQAAGFTPKDGKVHPDDKWHDAYYNGEKGAKATGTYTLKIVDADFAIGCFFTRKDPDNKIKWHSKSDVQLTAEERRKNKERIEEYQKQKRAEERKRHYRLSNLLTEAYRNLPKAKDHEYLTKKKIKPHGLKIRKKGNELIIPCYGTNGKVWTVQRITTKGKKFLFKGGKKKGSYFPFVSKNEDMTTILICEGFSTGASIREATGMPVAAAIDAGNVQHVLKALKKKFTKSKFILCADNDAFTFKNDKKPKGIDDKKIDGSDPRWMEWAEQDILWNVGIDKAKQAAVSVGGAHVVFPNFNEYDIKNKPTDFNDLHDIAGLEVVKSQILAAVNAIPVEPDEATGREDTLDSYQHPAGGGSYEGEDYFEPITIKSAGDFGMAFRCLGYNDGTNYYFSFRQRRIVALTPSQHTMQNLLQLDNIDNWQNNRMFCFDRDKPNHKQIALYAQNVMNELCTDRGVFKEEDNVRGGGAWIDRDRIVVHCGDRIYTEGRQVDFDEIDSDYTYIAAPKFMKPDATPLSNTESHKLREICELITWENNLSGSLLAGWLVIAPICGALDYRPHIWITGEAESGKSTVIKKVVRSVLGKIAISVEGGTTEASLREAAAHDARPLVYDEAEPSQTMENVIELARKATSGGIVRKHGQGQMRIRFAACFSSINPPVNKVADESRISFLVIRKNRKETALEDYEKLIQLIDENLTSDFSDRLTSRTIQNMETLFKNIKTFQKAARKIIKGARASEQIGTMLAGLYLLHTTKVATPEFAEDWISKYKWNEHTSIDEDSDPIRMIQHFASSIVRANVGGMSRDLAIGDMIMEAAAKSDKNNDYAKALRTYGINVVGQKVFIANRSPNLSRIFKGTDWGARWSVPLLNIDGSEKVSVHYFMAGLRTSAVSIPLSIFKEAEEPRHQESLALDVNEFPEDIPF